MAVTDSLGGFVNFILTTSRKPLEFQKEWTEALQKAGVYSVDELGSWTEEHWRRTTLPVDVTRIMQRDIQSFLENVRAQKTERKKDGNGQLDIKIDDARLCGITHKIVRFFEHHEGDGNQIRGFLSKHAVKTGFEAMRKMDNIPTGVLLDELEETMEELCYVNFSGHLKAPFLGLLLYGPPGTGKTQLCIQLCDLCGLTPVNVPIAATDANRPHVGETEEALRAIFARAKLMPHLLHCLAIDEIDGITQKRTNKVSEHAISTMSELLALVGGIKAVPNRIFFLFHPPAPLINHPASAVNW